MLKYILLLLTEYGYENLSEQMEAIREKTELYGTKLLFMKVEFFEKESFPDAINIEETDKEEMLIVTDDPGTAEQLLGRNYYVLIFYHDRNRHKCFPTINYAVEDLQELEYRSYDEIYRRLAGIPWDILETDRLYVRESTEQDVDAFYRIYQTPSITAYMEDLYEDRDMELAYMQAYREQIYGFYGYGMWTVILKETGEVIGRAGLSVREGYDLPELGFVIEASHQKRGYGYEVCSAILNYAKEELEFDEVQALADEKNVVSAHLLRKLGFVYERDIIESDRHYKLFLKKI